MPTAGYRSHEAFWIGGAAAPRVGTLGGYRSFCAFWMGGANGFHGHVPPPPIIVTGGGIARRHHPPLDLKLDELMDEVWREKLLREDEELVILLGAT